MALFLVRVAIAVIDMAIPEHMTVPVVFSDP